MRTCNTCGKTKPLDKFYGCFDHSRGAYYYRRRCRACMRGGINKRNRERFKDPELRRVKNARSRISGRKTRRARKDLAIEYMGGRCVDCVEDGRDGLFHRVVYHFHHIDPTKKEFTPTDLLCSPWETLTKELDKCVLLCSNCHCLRHKLGSTTKRKPMDKTRLKILTLNDDVKRLLAQLAKITDQVDQTCFGVHSDKHFDNILKESHSLVQELSPKYYWPVAEVQELSHKYYPQQKEA